ncbi:hypothetical protein 049ML003_66 [Bacillus phage 049ML003]|nr:hypothetical protein 049ML003_66 [Bacillus phage 049ML003]
MAKTFTDYNGKKGSVGSKVIEYTYIGEPFGEVKTVKEIMNRGRAGTFIYFEGCRRGGNSKWYGIVEGGK